MPFFDLCKELDNVTVNEYMEENGGEIDTPTKNRVERQKVVE